jgi:hypothetical protein
VRAEMTARRDRFHFNWIATSTLKIYRRLRYIAYTRGGETQRKAVDGGQIMQDIVELRTEETKAVVGGAMVVRGGGGLAGELRRITMHIIEELGGRARKAAT